MYKYIYREMMLPTPLSKSLRTLIVSFLSFSNRPASAPIKFYQNKTKMAFFFSLLKRVYLPAYNWVVFFGWAQVLFLAVNTLWEDGYQHVYDAVQKPLLLAQSAAFLEILHSLMGLVRSPIIVTFPQILSRLFVTWGVLYFYPEVRTHMLVSSLVLSWSITEIIRYSFFGMKEAFGFTPAFLLWLRYSTFFVFYPTGMSSEVGLAYLALPYIKEYEIICLRMPNKWNFSFHYYYACILGLMCYAPGFPHMYTYMLAQRKRVLSKSKSQ